jgi:hypothetical protein
MGFSKTGHDYRFDKEGELMPVEKNNYQAYPLGFAPPARER